MISPMRSFSLSLGLLAAAASPARAQEPGATEPLPAPPNTTLADVSLTLGSALALGLAPVPIDLLADDLDYGDAARISAVSTLGVVCAAGGAVLFVGGVAIVAVVAPLVAIFGEDGEVGTLFLAGGAMALVGLGMFLVSPLVFGLLGSTADEALADDTGDIALVATVETLLTAGAAVALVFLLDEVEASTWAKVLAVGAGSLLVASLSYGILRAIIDPEAPAPAMGMLLPPVRF
jgi:hypothetical protein